MRRPSGFAKALFLLCFICFILLTLNIFHTVVKKTEHLNINLNRSLKKNWEFTFIRSLRETEPGENGVAVKLEVLGKQISLANGFNAMLSDYISVNRSLPDTRPKRKYLANLPSVSIVIPFYNEYFSVLIRSVHSVINRSPPELIKEIILVDDFSQRQILFKTLDDYVAKNFAKTQIVRLSKRHGLIGARLAGMRKATGDVLLVLDSHIEANQNWLPPLLEPIALNKRVSVCPHIEAIRHQDFKYEVGGEGMRGAFDWTLEYKGLPRLHTTDKTKPYASPIMEGGLFAISREFFWELGGYDPGLDIWGGEQYELSFKIWMCGGELLTAPCSRVGHIYRGPRKEKADPREAHDYLHRNYKRVAEVWMDEFKQVLYEHDEGTYEKIDIGDVSAQIALRRKLKCHSFKWYMETVAFDILKKYSTKKTPVFAYGAIQSVAHSEYCIDTFNRDSVAKVDLFPCHQNLSHPEPTQNWEWSWYRDIRLRKQGNCLDVINNKINAAVWQYECHEQGGNQLWYYDRKNKLLMHGSSRKRCLEAKKDKKRLHLVVNKCNRKKKSMKWNFGYVNKTAINDAKIV